MWWRTGRRDEDDGEGRSSSSPSATREQRPMTPPPPIIGYHVKVIDSDEEADSNLKVPSTISTTTETESIPAKSAMTTKLVATGDEAPRQENSHIASRTPLRRSGGRRGRGRIDVVSNSDIDCEDDDDHVIVFVGSDDEEEKDYGSHFPSDQQQLQHQTNVVDIDKDSDVTETDLENLTMKLKRTEDELDAILTAAEEAVALDDLDDPEKQKPSQAHTTQTPMDAANNGFMIRKSPSLSSSSHVLTKLGSSSDTSSKFGTTMTTTTTVTSLSLSSSSSSSGSSSSSSSSASSSSTYRLLENCHQGRTVASSSSRSGNSSASGGDVSVISNDEVVMGPLSECDNVGEGFVNDDEDEDDMDEEDEDDDDDHEDGASAEIGQMMFEALTMQEWQRDEQLVIASKLAAVAAQQNQQKAKFRKSNSNGSSDIDDGYEESNERERHHVVVRASVYSPSKRDLVGTSSTFSSTHPPSSLFLWWLRLGGGGIRGSRSRASVLSQSKDGGVDDDEGSDSIITMSSGVSVDRSWKNNTRRRGRRKGRTTTGAQTDAVTKKGHNSTITATTASTTTTKTKKKKKGKRITLSLHEQLQRQERLRHAGLSIPIDDLEEQMRTKIHSKVKDLVETTRRSRADSLDQDDNSDIDHAKLDENDIERQRCVGDGVNDSEQGRDPHQLQQHQARHQKREELDRIMGGPKEGEKPHDHYDDGIMGVWRTTTYDGGVETKGMSISSMMVGSTYKYPGGIHLRRLQARLSRHRKTPRQQRTDLDNDDDKNGCRCCSVSRILVVLAMMLFLIGVGIFVVSSLSSWKATEHDDNDGGGDFPTVGGDDIGSSDDNGDPTPRPIENANNTTTITSTIPTPSPTGVIPAIAITVTDAPAINNATTTQYDTSNSSEMVFPTLSPQDGYPQSPPEPTMTTNAPVMPWTLLQFPTAHPSQSPTKYPTLNTTVDGTGEEINSTITTDRRNNTDDLVGRPKINDTYDDVNDDVDTYKCITSRQELYDAVHDYMMDYHHIHEIGRSTAVTSKYGSPIGTWCILGGSNDDSDEDPITSMSYLFYGYEQFNQNLSDWNIRGIYDFSGMFQNASSFRQDLCDWGRQQQQLSKDVNVTNMFLGTDCVTQEDPDLYATPPGPFCYPCLP